jgi:hypothetical protein
MCLFSEEKLQAKMSLNTLDHTIITFFGESDLGS